MLKELNGKDAVVLFRLEFVVHDVAGYDAEVLEAFGRGDRVNVLFLRARVGEAGYGAVGEDFGEVEGQGAPAAARMAVSFLHFFREKRSWFRMLGGMW